MDDITKSREIWAWLKAQGITFEVDEYAPVVVRFLKSRYSVELRVNAEANEDVILCPFFGSADNSLKALRAWCKKHDKCLEMHGIHWWIRNPIGNALGPDAEGKTDGEALLALLVKLMEEK